MGKPALLVLEDGSSFHGQSIGMEGLAVGEVVFNTSMTGYQEILTDPSYARQIVTFTCPHIGNVGANSADQESAHIYTPALIMRNIPLSASNFRAEEEFSAYLKRHQVVAIAEIDTRQLTHQLRRQGAQRGCVIAGNKPDAALALQQARACPELNGLDLAKVVTTAESYAWCQGSWSTSSGLPVATAERQLPYRVVVYDFGVKRSILRQLVDRGCQLLVVPAQTTAEAVLAFDPDGIVLSNGPGDPNACHYAIQAIQTLLLSEIPLFGICLGHQLFALACGAKTCKMRFGHHGGNHPIQDQSDRRIMITAQNHGFAVDAATLPATLQATHWSLFDGSLQGLQHLQKPAFSFQGHPEAGPGPQDVSGLFDKFITMIRHYYHGKSPRQGLAVRHWDY